MRTTRCGALIAAWLALGALPACDHVGSGSPGGGDADSDTDADTDSDSDSDADTDADTDPCADAQPYCCTGACPCPDAGDRCVFTYAGAEIEELGVCKPESEGGECWEAADCDADEFCAGVSVCPCEMDCDWEGPGICSPASGACCEEPGADCPDDYFCLALVDGTSTCHGILQYPQCWSDDDCYGGGCEGAELCPCDVDCMSEPGTCSGGA